MALIYRISRLFRADFHAVLDRVEEPGVLLKQALREMEDDLHEDNQQLKVLLNDKLNIEMKIGELDNTVIKINQELDLCFDSNESDLARSLVKRKIETQRYIDYVKRKYEVMDKSINELKGRIEENNDRFISMQQKLELFTDEKSSFFQDNYPQDMNITGFNNTVNDDEVEIAFLREKQLRSMS